MIKESGEGAASMATRPPTNGSSRPTARHQAHITLWLNGDDALISAWKLPHGVKHPPHGIVQGEPLLQVVPSLRPYLADPLQWVRRHGAPTAVDIPTHRGHLPCSIIPSLPQPDADPTICSIPWPYFETGDDAEGNEGAITETLSTLPVLAMEVDLAGRVVAINAKFAALMHISVGQMLPITSTQAHPTWQEWESDTPYRWCDLPIARVLQDYQSLEEFMLHHVAGSDVHTPYLAVAYPIHEAENRVSGAAWLLMPITTKVHADGIAQRRVSDIIGVVESMRDGILLYDARGRLWQMNPAAREMLGWDNLDIDPVEMSNQTRHSIHQPQHSDGRPVADAEQPLHRALAGESTEVEGFSLLRVDGWRINVGISAAPLRDRGGHITGAVLVLRDMTQQHRFEKLRENFMSLASHELRTPLTSLALVQVILEKQLVQSGASQSLLDLNNDLLNQVHQLNRLVENILDMAGLTGGQFELRRRPTDVTRLVHEVVEEHRLLHWRTKRDFTERLLDDPLWMDIDPQRISQVLYNLIANAVKFSLHNRPVEISMGRFSVGDTEWLNIDITDYGRGIPEDQLPTIFERLEEDDAEGSRSSGMGYSLFLSRAIIVAHGGTIVPNSVQHFGSTFSVRLPLQPPAAEEGA
jgi:PAS domain S-box-containing protein